MKKIFSIAQPCIVMALVVLLTVFSFLPVLTIDTTKKQDFMKEYEEGYLTKDASVPAEIDLGLGSLLTFIPEIGDIIKVWNVQFTYARMNTKIERLTEQKNEALEEEDFDDAEDYQNEIDALVADFDVLLEEIGDEKIAELSTKLEDEAFCKKIAIVYALYGLLPLEDSADDTVDYDDPYSVLEHNIKKSPFEHPWVELIVIAAFIAVIIVFMLVLPIFFLVKTIIRLISFIIGMVKGNYDISEKLAKGLPFSIYVGPILLSYAVIAYFVNDAVAIGGGFIPFIVTALLIGALRITDYVINRSRNTLDAANAVMKKAITLVSIILVLVFTFNFVGIGIYEEGIEDYYVFREVRMQELVKEHIEDGNDISQAITLANSDVEDGKRILYTYLPILAVILAAIVAGSLVDRFCSNKLKLKDGKEKEVNPQIVIAVLLIAVSIIPSSFSVRSLQSQENNYEDGNFVVIYDEYMCKGSQEYEQYTLLSEGLEKAKEEIKNSTGLTSEQIDEANALIAEGEKKLEQLKTNQKTCVSNITATSIIFLILEIAYLVLGLILGNLAKKAPERVASTKTAEDGNRGNENEAPADTAAAMMAAASAGGVTEIAETDVEPENEVEADAPLETEATPEVSAESDAEPETEAAEDTATAEDEPAVSEADDAAAEDEADSNPEDTEEDTDVENSPEDTENGDESLEDDSYEDDSDLDDTDDEDEE